MTRPEKSEFGSVLGAVGRVQDSQGTASRQAFSPCDESQKRLREGGRGNVRRSGSVTDVYMRVKVMVVVIGRRMDAVPLS